MYPFLTIMILVVVLVILLLCSNRPLVSTDYLSWQSIIANGRAYMSEILGHRDKGAISISRDRFLKNAEPLSWGSYHIRELNFMEALARGEDSDQQAGACYTSMKETVEDLFPGDQNAKALSEEYVHHSIKEMVYYHQKKFRLSKLEGDEKDRYLALLLS